MQNGKGVIYAPRFAHNLFTAKATALILAAGLAGEAVFEFVGWVIMPPILGRPVEPSFLIQDLAREVLGMSLSIERAFFLHALAGGYLFVVGYVFFADALKIRNATLAGLLWGVVLWAMAQGVYAPLAGRPFFLGFIPYTWLSILLHCIYSLPPALALEALGKRYNFPDREPWVSSRWVIGIPAVVVFALMVMNYNAAPSRGFANLTGYWLATGGEGDDPINGCLWLKQGGGGINVNVYLTAAAIEGGTPELKGQVTGDVFTLTLADGGSLQFSVGDGVLDGLGEGERAGRLTRADEPCM